MAELSPTSFNVAIAVIGLALYLFAWRVTKDLPAAAKVMSRLALALVALAPFVLAIFFKSEMPAPTASQNKGIETPSPEAARKAEEERRMAEQHAAGSQKATARKAEPPPPPTPTAPPPTTPGAPSSPPAQAPATDAKEGSAAPSDSRGLPRPVVVGSGPPVPLPPADYDVVPIFYGTDRAAKADPKRMQYDFERGKRLDLGRAMVTVPKMHEVPNIERPWVYRIPLTNIVVYQETEDPKKHFTMQEVKSLSRDDFLRLVRERLGASKDFKDHAVVFVHGFNTTFDYALYRAAQMAYDLKYDGASFVYSWPSKGQLGLQDYGYDRGSAEQAGPYLKEFLELVTRESGAKTVSIIAHSMGNLALLPVLRDLKNAPPPGVAISQIILAAPDVDRDLFEQLAKDIRGLARGTTLYVASNDWALELSKRLAGSVARAGDVPATGPLLLPDVDTIDVTDTSTDIFALHHSGYAEKTSLLKDIREILLTGKRPPDGRVPPLQRVLTEKGIYWKYPGSP